MPPTIELYDTTLRDGAQYEGISLSVDDKLGIARKLDELGIHYIEGGWPGSNPKDAEFFEQARSLKLNNAVLTAFGATRKANITPDQDDNLRALLDAGTSVVTLVGKSWDLHVHEILNTSLEENLAMVRDSISYLAAQGKRVFFDAEHFFDGYKANEPYAMAVVNSAVEAGVESVVLCDTNGGTLPSEIVRIVGRVRESTRSTGSGQAPVVLGIHTHNDSDTAVAGALAAIEAGVTQVQGTINGYGERCGNANLLSIVANLKAKLGFDCVTDEQLESLTEVSKYVAEVANMPHHSAHPYVGASAFAHKGGLHAQAVAKVDHSYQHIDPHTVGNAKRVLVSELSGRSNILYKIKELGMGVEVDQQTARRLLDEVKLLESKGFQYEGAEASFELLVRKMSPDFTPPFQLVDFMTMIEGRGNVNSHGDIKAQVMLKVKVGDEVMHTAADGVGPVNALDHALRKALLRFYPNLEAVRLIDYKVRVVEQEQGTEGVVRALIDSTDGHRHWSTVGASENIIEASWMALSDSFEYWLVRNGQVPAKPA